MHPIELGLDTFGDVTLDADGRPLPHAQVLRDVVDEAVLADQLGVDFIGVGEHHRADFAISAPEVVLAAIAARTERIRLGTAVTVLSSDDPVRVFQRFATLDAVSNGRAEVILGRGSFTESFPLFGYSLEDYDDLFEEKLELFAAIRDADRTGQPVHWKGTVRPPLEGMRVYPPVERPPLKHLGRRRRQPGVGGPRRALRLPAHARHHRRRPAALRPLRRALPPRPRPARPAEHAAGRRPLAGPHRRHRRAGARGALAALPGHAQPDRRRARLAARPAGPSSTARSPRARCTSARPRRSPARSPRPCARSARSRFDLKYSAGTLPHEAMMRSIELYGREVIPRVRELVAETSAVLANHG